MNIKAGKPLRLQASGGAALRFVLMDKCPLATIK